MTFNLSIPRNGGTPLDLPIKAGEVVFLLGANGTGKSSLMHSFYKAHHTNARRLTAHRQTCFESDAIMLSPQQKKESENYIRSQDRSPDARWREVYPAQRLGIAIYDLVDTENLRARAIAEAFDRDDFDRAKDLREKDAPITVINELLRQSNVPVKIAIGENAQVVASKNGGVSYSVAELSDGERNALLIAANVLTAKPGSLLLIDEPERHLHRSITSPLLTLLFVKRPDCAFVVSTHDVMLPFGNLSARTLLLRGCTYNGLEKGSVGATYDVDLVSSSSEIDDDLKRDILGARRKILFVEGTETSLDKPLYTLLFPDVSIIAKGSCREVERAVSSIRGARDLHWLDAFGLVDNDRRPEAEIERLRKGGTYATAVFSVEGLYYHPDIQRRVAKRHANTTGDNPDQRIEEATAEAISSINTHAPRLSERVAEKRVREAFFAHIPNRVQLSAAEPLNISIDIPQIVREELARFQTALETRNLETIISRYPVRETPALDAIARKLGFQGRSQYESAVRKLLMDDAAALEFARSFFGTLAADISAGTCNSEASVADMPPAIVVSCSTTEVRDSR